MIIIRQLLLIKDFEHLIFNELILIYFSKK